MTPPIYGLISFERWRTPQNACLNFAAAESLVAGDSVEVIDSVGSVIATTTLAVAADPASADSCILEFELPGVEILDEYQFRVAGRTTTMFSRNALESAGWSIDLSPDTGVYLDLQTEGNGSMTLSLTAPVTAELSGATGCKISTDERYPDRGLMTIRMSIPGMGDVELMNVGLDLELKAYGDFLTFLDAQITLDNNLAYRAMSWHMTAARFEPDVVRGFVEFGNAPHEAGGPSFQQPGDVQAISGQIDWVCTPGA